MDSQPVGVCVGAGPRFSGHPWLAEPGVAPEEPLPPMVLSRLKQFTSMVKLKRVAMMVRPSPARAMPRCAMAVLERPFSAQRGVTVAW